ncbi:MAG: 2-oxo acid dehydrogenase subunit E2 [Bacteroidetes bacterium]|nr:2-oxo acid dehydrogenase subunit E2 [Bacteroidota bacterium]
MAEFQIVMPKMGESIAEATIIRWLKKEGDLINLDEAVLEIATDKVDSEIPSPFSGILSKKLFNDGDVVEVGKTLAIIVSDVNETTENSKSNLEIENNLENVSNSKTNAEPEIKDIPLSPIQIDETPHVKGETNKFYSPLVLNIARQEGVSVSELENINGTGNDNRVTKRDILAYIEEKKSSIKSFNPAPVVSVHETKTVTAPQPKITLSGGDEIIEMDRMRKLIAEHMVMSKHTSPHVTSFVEADVTNIVNWRNKIKDTFNKREGENFTFTPIFIYAIVKAIKDFPMINISLDGDKIIKKKNINIGMATALPSGNLIVPVIKNADTKSLLGLAKEVNNLSNKARNSKLLPEDIQDGTYTITNVGTFGNVLGTPIINQPQVAIMATGAIRKKPAVIETEYGDVIAVRHMMYLSHSYDHRVVDGALGGSFVKRVADYLENWDLNTEI